MIDPENKQSETQSQETEKPIQVQPEKSSSELRQERLAQLNQELKEFNRQASTPKERQQIQEQRESEYQSKIAELEKGLGIKLSEQSADIIHENIVDSTIEQAQKENERFNELQKEKTNLETISAKVGVNMENNLEVSDEKAIGYATEETEKSTNYKPDALKSEHLREGVSPIVACIGTSEQFENNPGIESEAFTKSSLSNAHNVDYYKSPEQLKKQEFKNAGVDSYVISPVDNLDKFSEKFMDCTGVVIAGQDKETDESISFMSHQDPLYFLENSGKEQFVKDLTERLNELKERSAARTIDAVVIGGNYIRNDDEFKTNYLKSIKLLSAKISEVLGFEPVIITGPKLKGGEDIFYNNKNRKLFIKRPHVGDRTSESFLPRDIEKKKKEWE